MVWKDQLKRDPIPWLMEEDNPGVRYLAMRDVLDYPFDHPELVTARKKAHIAGPISVVLANINEVGYWEKPGPGYLPKYFSTVWSLILLAQLGARVDLDHRIKLACDYIVEHALTEGGHFTSTGAPSGTADCLQGNLCAALLDLGYQDARLDRAYEWMARSLTGDGVSPANERKATRRFYAGKFGPDFVCGANNKLSCAWGGAKVMLAFSKLPVQMRTPLIDAAIERGISFLFSVDPASAEYPSGWSAKPSGNWWKFGFPVFYVTDILQIVEALIGLGYGNDKRLVNAMELILEKQDHQGRWHLEYSYAGKTWVDFGEKKQPNKWVTLRALKVLKQQHEPC